MVGYHYVLRGFHRYPVVDRPTVPAADPGRGPDLFRAHGCVGCHTIPGVPEATGKVGPRLDRVKEQSYIAGVLPNRPQYLVEWIRRPKEIDPHTAMPNLGVGPEDARDMAAYLYTLP
jgi:mono/diheme cytochrome c family protein